MIYRLLTTIGMLSLFLLVSCSDDEDKNPIVTTTITGSGTLVTVDRTVASFHSVSLATVGKVNITSGSPQSVSVTVDDNIETHISTTVNNGVLLVSHNPAVNLSDFELTVDLTMTDLEALTITGVGTIATTNRFEVDELDLLLSGVGHMILDLDADRISSVLSGVGNLLLTGAVDRHNCIHSAVGSIQAFELVSDTTVAHLSGVGNAEVYVNDSLNVIISGIGSLLYRGDPTIVQTISGSGQVIDAN